MKPCHYQFYSLGNTTPVVPVISTVWLRQVCSHPSVDDTNQHVKHKKYAQLAHATVLSDVASKGSLPTIGPVFMDEIFLTIIS